MSVDIFFFGLILFSLVCFFARAIWFLNSAVSFEFKHDIRIELRKQKNGSKKWVIRKANYDMVYSKEGSNFIYEPLPSNRTDEFISDTRFDSFHMAYKKYKQIAKSIDYVSKIWKK